MSQSIKNNIVQKSGMSASSLARYLGVHGTVLSHMDRGNRSLPEKFLPKMATLYGLLSQLPSVTDPVPNAEEIAEVRKEAEWQSALLFHQQRQLQSIRDQYAQAATLQQLMQAYEALHPPESEQQRRWIDDQYFLALKRMKQNGWKKQQQLSLEIQVMQTKIDALWKSIDGKP